MDDQFRASSQDTGRHKYFLLPYKNLAWGPAIEQASFIPLPAQILNDYRKVECASFTGLLPEIHRFEYNQIIVLQFRLYFSFSLFQISATEM